MRKRIIAIHLPQYYPFPENDEWWGKGFTEWRNVASAKPRYKGHYQPHIPADLGFYDLRMPEARKMQQDLAREHGIDGFCYYHYWFNGHLLMEKPVEAMLHDKTEDFPFMFCWANEDWHRNWAGKANETLIKQKYSKEDDIEHFKYLLPFFKDDRYIKIDGRPVFAIYKTQYIPNVEKMIETFQAEAMKEGFQLYICKFEANGCRGKEYMVKGIDSAIDFQPINHDGYKKWYTIIIRILNKIIPFTNFGFRYSYENYVKYRCDNFGKAEYKTYPCVFPCWDNSSRRVGQVYTVYHKSKPAIFEKWLNYVYKNFNPFSVEENLIFVNAWNEWAEGCHLEPDLKNGLGFLEAVKKVTENG